MQKLKIIFTVIMLSLIMGVTNAKTTKVNCKGKEKTSHCTKSKNHVLTGKATYYGSNYKTGRLTASGRPFDKNKLTAAHKTLPFGTIVLVTNKKTGKSVQVEITDRGPFGPGRVIDLSVRAFKEIASLSQGVVPVELKIISKS